MTSPKSETYSQGHKRAVTAVHAARTAENDGAFALPYIKPHFHILDLGCGPGSITIGFAKYVPRGSVVGVDLNDQIIEQATEILSAQTPKPANVSFQKGNVLQGLPFADGQFDLIFTSQVLIHIPDPVAAIRELKRVCKPDTGVLCLREGDLPFHQMPRTRGLQLFWRYNIQVWFGKAAEGEDLPAQESFSMENKGGRFVHVWARQAGFDPRRIEKGGRMQIYSTDEERQFFGGSWVKRLAEGGLKEKMTDMGATDEEVQEMVRAWKDWENDVDGWFGVAQCEVVCHN